MEFTVNRGDVFYASLGFDGTSRQGGTRPIVIVSNQACNQYSPIVSVVCLTTSHHKVKLPTHVELLACETGLAIFVSANNRCRYPKQTCLNLLLVWTKNI